eukprot:1316266-Rhodomonas_salina.2
MHSRHERAQACAISKPRVGSHSGCATAAKSIPFEAAAADPLRPQGCEPSEFMSCEPSEFMSCLVFTASSTSIATDAAGRAPALAHAVQSHCAH